MGKLYSLHQSDAFDWLSQRRKHSVHAVVTDPPFAVVEYLPAELQRKSKGKGLWRIPRAHNGNTRMSTPRFTVLGPAELYLISTFHRLLAPELYRVLVPGSHVVMAAQGLLSFWVVEAFLEAGFEVRGQIARTVRTLRGGERPKGAHNEYPDCSVLPRSCWEPWLIFRKPCVGRVSDNLAKWGTGALRRPGRNSPFLDLISSAPARGEERKIAPHPSLKPQAFMRQIVSAVLPLSKGVILDPFMGSGSTIAAATALRLRSIGVEIAPEYYRLAKTAIPRLAKL